MTVKTDKILLIGFGNPARGDDGLGPALAEAIEAKNVAGVTVDADYQLTIEDSARVAEHDIVIFADASINGPEPFSFESLEAKEYDSFSSHSVEPAQVLALAENLFNSKAAGYILGIRGYEFDKFGEKLTKNAADNLKQAVGFIENLLKTKNFDKPKKTIACL